MDFHIFPKPFSKPFPELDADWLFPHHPIPNAEFPPVAAMLNWFLPSTLYPRISQAISQAISQGIS